MPASFRVFEEDEISEVATLGSASLAIIDHAFSALAEGRVIMPAPLGLHIKDDDVEGEVHVKTAYIRGSQGFAVKVATGFYQNVRLGLPTSSGIVLYLDSQTGKVVALFADNGYLTDLRTALAGAVAAKHLAPTRIATVGIVGTGIQARWQLRAIALVREFQQVLVFGRSAAATEAYIRDMQIIVPADIRRADTVSELVRQSDLVVTTTPSREALIKAQDLHAGLHITAMGSDGPSKRELESSVLDQADVVVCDSYDQCLRLGELQHAALPRASVVELGDVTSGMRKGRSNDHQISVCDLTGTGVQDSAIAEYAFSALRQRGTKHS
jgi:ornithine cyclodeaminase/alanine dehydrogenase-like protein (mu-crystallin family)